MKGVVKDRLIKAVMTKSKNEEMCLEMLGMMAAIRIGKEWTDILLGSDKFIEFLEKTMINGISEDDLLMEAVMVVSNICQEAESCNLIERTPTII
jgi:hypothetical protein